MTAIMSATSASTLYDRRCCVSIVLKLLKRIVLTMRRAGTTMTASAMNAHHGSWSPSG